MQKCQLGSRWGKISMAKREDIQITANEKQMYSSHNAGPESEKSAPSPLMTKALSDQAGGPVLAVEDLTVRIGARTLLQGVTFSVQPGEFCGLIGENGAGKTTLLRSLIGLQHTPHGRVSIGGLDPAKSRDLVGYVPQKIVFSPDLPLRVYDLVQLGCDGHRLGPRWFSRRLREQVDRAIHAVGAESFAYQRIGELSGGQQQRAVIAHAMARQPRLLLLDEPLANLDFRSASELAQLLGHLTRVHGIAVLVTAHDMNPLLSLLDRIVYLARGRAASGSVDEVVQAQSLSRLYGYPVAVIKYGGRILVLPNVQSQEREDICYLEENDGDGGGKG
ncbi:MAG: metal ABC transporter ATP-binding protein [Phycisphaerae bacterium]